MQQQPTLSRSDFSDFKKQFEASHPEQAKELQESLRPRHERLALEAEKQIKLLEKAIEQSRTPRTHREQLEKYAAQISKQPDVMTYLKQHNVELSDKIQSLAKSREINLDRDRGGRSL